MHPSLESISAAGYWLPHLRSSAKEIFWTLGFNILWSVGLVIGEPSGSSLGDSIQIMLGAPFWYPLDSSIGMIMGVSVGSSLGGPLGMFIGLAIYNYFGTWVGFLVGVSLGALVGLVVGT